MYLDPKDLTLNLGLLIMFSLYKSKKGRVLWGLGRVCPFVAVATAATYCHYDLR